MHFIVVGLNFKTADVSVREKIYFSAERLSEALSKLNAYASVKGSVILSTCNRVEIYSSVLDIERGFKDTIDFISKFHNIPIDSLLPSIYKKNCKFAVNHLFRVATSLDSMVVGEYQIQGQLKCAYFFAKEQNCTNGMLNKLFQLAIQTGKKVRSETKIGEGSVSVATLAIQIVKQIFQEKDTFNILLIGAGKISTLTANNFQQQFKKCNISVSNRSVVNASEMAKKFNANVINYENKLQAVINNDIIIASTSSESYIINKNDILNLQNDLGDRKRIFIDLSIPRNIDPDINDLNNCLVYSIDDINKIIESTLDKRSSEIEKVEKIIEEISEVYYDWYFQQFIIPTMLKFKRGLGFIKRNTVQTYEPLMNSLDEEQQQAINEMLDTYSDKVIKVIMKSFRKASIKSDMISITKAIQHNFSKQLNEQKEKIHNSHPS